MGRGVPACLAVVLAAAPALAVTARRSINAIAQYAAPFKGTHRPWLIASLLTALCAALRAAELVRIPSLQDYKTTKGA